MENHSYYHYGHSVQGFTLVSIFAPNSLMIGSASPRNDVLNVPSIFFDTSKEGIGWTSGFGGLGTAPSKHLQRGNEFLDARSSLTSSSRGNHLKDVRVGVTIPSSTLRLPYFAPISAKRNLGNGDVDQASDPTQPTVQLSSPSWSLTDSVYNANYYLNHTGAAIAIAWRTQDTSGAEATIGGARCSLYNTTQKAVVSFLNNTATILPSIISYKRGFRHLRRYFL